MFKFVGLLGLISSAGLIGIYKYILLKRRVEILDDYLKLVLEMKSQINYFKEPLPILFRKIVEKNNIKSTVLIKEVLRCHSTEKNIEINEIWALKANEIYKYDPLEKEDMDLIVYLGNFIGQTDYENQIFQFNYIESKLNEQILNAENELKTKGPLMKKMGFIIGIMISIVLL